MKTIIKYITIWIVALFIFSCSSNHKDSTEQKIEELLSKMTLEEKVGQLNQYTSRWEMTGPAPADDNLQQQSDHIKSGKVGSMLNVIGAEETRKAQELAVNNSRLGIPMIFGYDVVHGFKTMFPIPLGLSSSWNDSFVEEAARIAAKEASASGIHWTFAPMVDISRDARWGRVMEGFGEDPYLTAKMGVANVQGFQGSNLYDSTSIAACAKHFAAYGFAEAGRDYNTVDISLQTLHNIILPPFKACANANVATFMNAFNEIGGIPSTSNSYLQRTILKDKWNYDGFVVSDWGSIEELVVQGTAHNNKEAALQAILAGSDMDMEGNCYLPKLAGLVNEGTVKEFLIDDAVRRILKVKFDLGLFDDPYKYCSVEREKREVLSEEHMNAARKIARESMVLLKNDNHILPIKNNIKSIAVIGELAASKDVPLGSWRAQAIENSAVSLLEGLQHAFGKEKIAYAKGYKLAIGNRSFLHDLELNKTDKSDFNQAIALAKKSELVIVAVGEDCWQTGEARSQAKVGLQGVQLDLLQELKKVNQNIVAVLMNGRPLELNWVDEHIPAVLETWHAGSEAGNAIADILSGKHNPSGKLTMSFPRNEGQLPLYYNHKNTGRPENSEGLVFWSHYTDEKNTPLYPFGYGLSYTTYEYSNLSINKKQFKETDKVQVTIDVSNTGNIDGDEIIQLYIRDVVASMTRPIKELKGYKKTRIKAGETKQVTFELTKDDLSFYDNSYTQIVEPGIFQVFVGGSSVSVLETEFELIK